MRGGVLLFAFGRGRGELEVLVGLFVGRKSEEFLRFRAGAEVPMVSVEPIRELSTFTPVSGQQLGLAPHLANGMMSSRVYVSPCDSKQRVNKTVFFGEIWMGGAREMQGVALVRHSVCRAPAVGGVG